MGERVTGPNFQQSKRFAVRSTGTLLTQKLVESSPSSPRIEVDRGDCYLQSSLGQFLKVQIRV